MTDIFISYSRADREKVRHIANALEAEGFDVWWDPEIPPGESFSRVIDAQLKQSKCIIAVWSKSSINSNWVQEEADDGMMRNTLIPVMIDEVDLPRGFKRLQTADLRDWVGDIKNADWQLIIAQVRKLVAARDATDAAERQAAIRTQAPRPAPAQHAPAQRASAPPPTKTAGGFPVLPAILGVSALVAAGAGYLLFAKSDDAAPAEQQAASKEVEPPAATEVLADATMAPATSSDDEVAAAGLDLQSPAANPVDTVENEDIADPTEDLTAAVEDGAEPLIDEVADVKIVAGEKFRDCDACPELIAIGAGAAFMMGAAADEYGHDNSELPQISVTIERPFAIGVFEVSHDEWQACVDDNGCESYAPADMGWGRGARPVANISINDANKYLEWLSEKTAENYRLPSEAEWEFAARGGARTTFHTGDLISTSQANFNGQYPYKNAAKGAFRSKTLTVGSFAPNPLGVFDMNGNVWEWTADCWRPSHNGAPIDGSPVRGACSQYVIKGGAWNAGAWRLRPSHRKAANASKRDFSTGFRVSRDL